jgi:hypothetical protein
MGDTLKQKLENRRQSISKLEGCRAFFHPKTMRYVICENGAIYSLIGMALYPKPLKLKPMKCRKGYLSVRISVGQELQKMRQVHRLVFETFKGLPPKHVVGHIDRDRSHNHLSNLQVLSKAEYLRNQMIASIHRQKKRRDVLASIEVK